MGGLHYWWPKITGRMYPEKLGQLAALITYIGFNLTFFPQFVVGYLGMPRRYHAYPPEFQIYHVLSSAGASILGVGLSVAADLSDLVASNTAKKRRPIPGTPPDWNGKRLRRRRSITLKKRRSSHADLTNIQPKRRKRRRRSSWLTAQAVLAEQFDDMPQQQEAATLGMWTFLATEVLFFGGDVHELHHLSASFIRTRLPRPASTRIVLYGTMNTAILLTSSLTMALAVHAAQESQTKWLVRFLLLTVFLGLLFPRRQRLRI